MMRSKLFVPGSRPELFPKALAGPADGISIDLEDAVAEPRKAEARDAVARFLRQGLPAGHGKVIVVRVNAQSTRHFTHDVEAVVGPGLDVVNVPKVESADQVRSVAAALALAERERGLTRPVGLLVTVESPRALRLAGEIACADPRVVGLQLGFADLLEPLGIDRTDEAAVHHLQLQLRLAAGEAGVAAYDTVWANIADPDGFRREANAARRLGYAGKSCIHPSQVPLANETFRPTDEEIQRAIRVVAAARDAEAKGLGVFTVDGRMVDAPFIRRAETIVGTARRLGLLQEA